MPTQPDPEPIDLATEAGRERFAARLRAAGIQPATEWEDRDDRVAVRAPSWIENLLLRIFRRR